jgi:hypothetical protein
MKMHLISLNLSVWTIVHIGVDFSDEDEEPGFEQLQQIHHNAQASSVLLSLLKKMSLIGSMALRRLKTFGTLFKELMKAPNPRRRPRGNSLKGNLIDLSCLMMNTLKRCTTGSRS